ncbi:MAG: hypothetical protein O7D92_07245 [Proteobacteria bacterium]|nr:hypothetical protein [Pseudomonadota bacterium]
MGRPKILVFRHVPFEPLGTLDPLLKNAGFRIRYVNFARDPKQVPSLDGYSALPLMELSNRTFSRWIDRFETDSRRRTLPSR